MEHWSAFVLLVISEYIFLHSKAELIFAGGCWKHDGFNTMKCTFVVMQQNLLFKRTASYFKVTRNEKCDLYKLSFLAVKFFCYATSFCVFMQRFQCHNQTNKLGIYQCKLKKNSRVFINSPSWLFSAFSEGMWDNLRNVIVEWEILKIVGEQNEFFIAIGVIRSFWRGELFKNYEWLHRK